MVLAYVAWILGPYLRSVVIRDAAVTVWIHVATSPIYGNVDQRLPALGSRVGADGRILSVHNEHADRTRLDAAAADVVQKEAVLAELEVRMSGLERAQADWQRLSEAYAATLKNTLEADVDGARRELGFITQRPPDLRARAGTAQGSPGTQGQCGEIRCGRGQCGAGGPRAAAGRAGEPDRADRAVPRFRSTGCLPAERRLGPGLGAFRTRETLELERARVEGEHAGTRAGLDEARALAAAEADLYRQLNEGVVAAPPGSMIRSMIVGAGAAVDIGSPVAQWRDCTQLLVDVPLSDVEVALLRDGMAADVVIEGENVERRGTVVLTRGAAATLGATDLAAVAKGRRPGVGQALLSLERTGMEEESCPVGLAAFVDFPELSLISVLQARLRP